MFAVCLIGDEGLFEMSFPVGNPECMFIDTCGCFDEFECRDVVHHVRECVFGDPGIILITNE